MTSPRIIDANINRLMEGLRVVEDISRFGLNDKKQAQNIKLIRGKVKVLARLLVGKHLDLISSRDSAGDVGRSLETKSEESRSDIFEIWMSNIKRAQEACRVLEEFFKLEPSVEWKAFKGIRYELYSIEKCLAPELSTLSKRAKLDFGLYVVTDPDVLGRISPVSAVKEVIKGGCKIVQLRDKKASIGQYYAWAKEIAPICKKASVSFIVNDYIDVCLAVEADGVHIGQDDVPVDVARKILGKSKMIGLSTHSYAQAIAGAKSDADYISIGPVFTTQSKPNTIPVGLKLVKQFVASKSGSMKPFVCIGGINENNIKSVIDICGDKKPRVAVIRAAIGQKNIADSVRKLSKHF